MECCDIKLLPVVGPDGLLTFQLVPCGKCYACQCGKRGEMVLRMEHEIKDKYNVSKYFFTLTYSDKFLPVVCPDWPSLSSYYHLQDFAYRHYDYALLEPWRLSQFLYDVRREFLLDFCHGYKDKHDKVYSDEDNTWLRYFCTGEYGDISHRPHYHGCLMFPREVNWQDACNMIAKCWPYGNRNVQVLQTKGACNYVAKHQVKECIGSKFQQVAMPSFARYSTYRGGLGRILKDDEVMKQRYLDSLKTRDKSLCYYTTYQGGLAYKVAIPRFLIKTWHPDRFSDEELVLSQKDGFEKLQQYIFDNLTDNLYLSTEFKEALSFVDFQLEFIQNDSRYGECQDVDYQNYEQLQALSVVLRKIGEPLKAEDEKRRKIYINKHITRKLSMLANSHGEGPSVIY